MPTPRTIHRRQCQLASLRPEPRRKGSGVAARPSVRWRPEPSSRNEPQRRPPAASPATIRSASRLSIAALSPLCIARGYVRAASAANAADRRHHGRSRGPRHCSFARRGAVRPRRNAPAGRSLGMEDSSQGCAVVVVASRARRESGRLPRNQARASAEPAPWPLDLVRSTRRPSSLRVFVQRNHPMRSSHELRHARCRSPPRTHGSRERRTSPLLVALVARSGSGTRRVGR